ncbi:hypothetical protein FGLOB1_3729 [Fusarium globosum]|uniref:Uncharacterized protein n=1 Tax=Fusarium globosum TaxID=78864 RepID=A0A8H5YKT8_9HYPO|nr:hypothetical protein FGLOB1_3729 [Fusarium globosum]
MFDSLPQEETMSPEASEKTDMSVEMPSKESVEKPDMTGQVTKTLEAEATQECVKEVNGRRFTYRSRYKDGPSHALLKDWFDEDGHSIEWWEKKSLLRDWIYGRMSPEEFDAHFPHYMGPPKEWCRITKEAHEMPQEEKESFGLKKNDELGTQPHANNYDDGSGLPHRPGMGPSKTEEDAQKLGKDGQATSDCVNSLSPEEFSAQSPGCNKSNAENTENPEDSEDGWNEEEVYWMLVDDTERRLREEYLECLWEERSLKEDEEETPRYATYYGDSSGLPLRPGMGPPMTEEEREESLKKWQAEEDEFFNMSENEVNDESPESENMSQCLCTEDEAMRLMEEFDEAHTRRREEMIRKWKESRKARPEDQL